MGHLFVEPVWTDVSAKDRVIMCRAPGTSFGATFTFARCTVSTGVWAINTVAYGAVLPCYYMPFTPDSVGGSLTYSDNAGYRYWNLNAAAKTMIWNARSQLSGCDTWTAWIVRVSGGEDITIQKRENDTDAWADIGTITTSGASAYNLLVTGSLSATLTSSSRIRLINKTYASGARIHYIRFHRASGIWASGDHIMASGTQVTSQAGNSWEIACSELPTPDGATVWWGGKYHFSNAGDAQEDSVVETKNGEAFAGNVPGYQDDWSTWGRTGQLSDPSEGGLGTLAETYTLSENSIVHALTFTNNQNNLRMETPYFAAFSCTASPSGYVQYEDGSIAAIPSEDLHRDTQTYKITVSENKTVSATDTRLAGVSMTMSSVDGTTWDELYYWAAAKKYYFKMAAITAMGVAETMGRTITFAPEVFTMSGTPQGLGVHTGLRL